VVTVTFRSSSGNEHQRLLKKLLAVRSVTPNPIHESTPNQHEEAV
jgi:hypothetical protein